MYYYTGLPIFYKSDMRKRYFFSVESLASAYHSQVQFCVRVKSGKSQMGETNKDNYNNINNNNN